MFNLKKSLLGILFMFILILTAAVGEDSETSSTKALNKSSKWIGVHVFAPWHKEMPEFKKSITDVYVPWGVNVLIVEVNYKFKYMSHPELREGGDSLTKEDVKELVEICRKNNIRLIPQFNCLGHQSWAQTNFPLITKYPEFDETSGIPMENKDIYCRSWCPLHPKVNAVIFDLFNELIDAFECDAFHVGMDEVFLIGDKSCSRCSGKDPAELFAKAVNDYYNFLVKEKKLTMLMWGDRLIDSDQISYGKYEASANGTAKAIDMVPKDIIICDWHYEVRKEYPSVKLFQDKGFRVLPSTWHNEEATRAMIEYSNKNKTDKLIGHLFTTWVGAQDMSPAFISVGKLPDEALKAAYTMKVTLPLLKDKSEEKK